MSEPKNFLARWARRKRDAAEAEHVEPKSPAVPEPTTPLVPAKAGTQTETTKSEQAALDSRLRGNERERGGDPTAKPGAGEPLVDLTKLPPLESITAETDIRAFLAPGVPPELTRAALRRAWSADPAIRDYVGLSENAWDFNAPESISGFGPLQMTAEFRRQIMRMIGGGSADAADRTAAASTEVPKAQASPGTSVGLVAADPAVSAREVEREDATRPDQPRPSAEEPGGYGASLQRKKDDAAVQPKSDKAGLPQCVARRSHGRALPD
jgi:hypothetical protein